MKVYKMEYDVENYLSLAPVSEEALHGTNLWVNGSLKLSSWSPPLLKWDEPTGNENKPDIAYLNPSFFAYNQKSMATLGPLLEKHGELLPFIFEDSNWTAFNPTEVVDCLDKEKSEYKTRRSGEKGRLLKAVLNKSAIPQGTSVFKIPEKTGSSIFVTEKFVDAYKESKLSGLKFITIEVS